MEKTVFGVRLLKAEIDCRREDTADIRCYAGIAKELGIPRGRMKQALRVAAADFEQFRSYCRRGLTLDEAAMVLFDKIPLQNFEQPKYRATIGLLGYIYNVYDPFISMEIIKRLRELKVRVLTFDMLSEKELFKYRRTNTRPIFWTFADKLYQAAHVMIRDKGVDGLIHITAFGCGPDSVVGKEIEHDFAERGVPFMTLRIDEHTGENHLQTRIEAFTDMIKRKIYHREKEQGATVGELETEFTNRKASVL